MSQLKHNARVALRRAIKQGTDEEKRLAAIEFCYAHNIDPHWRWPVWPKLNPDPWNGGKPLDISLYSVTQWEQNLRRAVADPHFLSDNRGGPHETS